MGKGMLLLTMLFCFMPSMAQQKLSFSVLEFEQDVFDTSAKSTEYGKKDGNGSWYAIIKVTSNNPDDDITACQFNFGNMSSKVEKHDEALWVYVQRNAKKVTISRPGYHTISQYDLQTTIEAGAVYKMVLKGAVTHQKLFVRCSPANAVVLIDGKSVDVRNGRAQLTVQCGSHKYTVVAAGYYQQDGIINVEEESPANLVAELVKNEVSNVTSEEEKEEPTSINKEQRRVKIKENIYAVESSDLEPLFLSLTNMTGIKWNETIDDLQRRLGGHFKSEGVFVLRKGIYVFYGKDRKIYAIEFVASELSPRDAFPLPDTHLSWTSKLDSWIRYFNQKGIKIKNHTEFSVMTSFYAWNEGVYQLKISNKSILTKQSVLLTYTGFQ